MISIATKENFETLKSKELVLVDFFATWCGPCRMLGPVLEEIEDDRKALQIVKVDVDECSELARIYGIMSVPTLLLFKNGNLISKRSGYMNKEELTTWINESK